MNDDSLTLEWTFLWLISSAAWDFLDTPWTNITLKPIQPVLIWHPNAKNRHYHHPPHEATSLIKIKFKPPRRIVFMCNGNQCFNGKTPSEVWYQPLLLVAVARSPHCLFTIATTMHPAWVDVVTHTPRASYQRIYKMELFCKCGVFPVDAVYELGRWGSVGR